MLSFCARFEMPREELYRTYVATQAATTPGQTLSTYYEFRQALVDTMMASADPHVFRAPLELLQYFGDVTATLLSAGDNSQADFLRQIVEKTFGMAK